MPLQKQNVSINFSQGLETKTDPFQVPVGKFLSLENSVFNKGGLLSKRNGYLPLPSLSTNFKYLSTFSGNLVSVGTSVSALSSASNSWVSRGSLTPVQLETLPLVRTSSNQSQVDTAIASNGLVCTVYTNSSPSTTYNYVIADSITGQNIVSPTLLSTPSESPRVFVLGNYFIILFSQAANIKYVAIPVNNPSAPLAAVTLVVNYAIGATELAFDAVVANNNLYVAYNGSDGGGAIRMTFVNSFLVRQTANTGTNVANAKSASFLSICADTISSSPIIWVSFYTSGTTSSYALAVDQQLTSVLAATLMTNSDTIVNLATAAQNGVLTFLYEDSNTYSYGTSLPSDFISCKTITQAGSITSLGIIVRSVGLASKAFIVAGKVYVLSAYSSAYQPSYFLISSSGSVVTKLAYSNGGGYLTLGLPSVTVTGTTAQVGYLIKDLLVPTNKNQNPTNPTGAPNFSQTGINLVSFNFTTDGMNSSEIGNNLHVSGGLLWAYDGYSLVEQGFNLYPDNVIVTTATGSGSITANDYWYQAIYEWTDSQGNIQRSAPSLAIKQTTTTSSSTNTIKIPTLRLTYKSLVKIVLYRYSTAQQTYYQVTSVTSPTLNSTTTDSVTITDAQSDSQIVGNSILYTTGGVVENIGAPATTVMTLFKSRLFLVDAEDRNLLWYSKQVIESTPVEMSDLFTIYVAPTVSAQGNTGPITALSAMDDKLIIFKKDAIYYLVGTGPDNTGANNDFSDPVFVTSTVGCSNQNSIVFMPQGLMFKSDKGIWLLGRDLSTTYIGAPVEKFNGSDVLSALAIPGTNQVRFNLSTGEVLMYDYYYQQWGSFSGIPGISATLYQNLHVFIDSYGRVFQESVGSYLDGSKPVLMNFTTGWLNLAGLQGYERSYFFYLLATYLSPHKLNVQIAYDYNASPTQSSVISPHNYSPPYGDDSLYGGSEVFGGASNVEQWRVFLQKQKCEAFQISVQEIFDSSFGVTAGAGFSMSGINLIIGAKSGYPRLKAAVQVG